MKNLYILFISLFSLSLSAQDTIKHWFETYYYEKEGIEIPSLHMELADSSVIERFKNATFTVGVPQRCNIDFIEAAKKIERNDTVEYLLHLYGQDTRCVGVYLKLNAPSIVNARSELINGELVRELSEMRPYIDESNPYGFFTGIDEKEYIIRLVVPKTEIPNVQAKIKSLEYCVSFVRNVGFKLNTVDKMSSSSPNYTCSYVSCLPEFNDWAMEWKSTFQITSKVKKDGWSYSFTATGFLLNTEDNYGMDLKVKPYAMTCYHYVDSAMKITGFSLEDIVEGTYEPTETWIKFRWLDNCSGTSEYSKSYYPKFEVLEKGNWYTNNDYEEDYIFMRIRKKVDLKEIQDKGFALAGWRNDLVTSGDYINLGGPGYIFHHADELRGEKFAGTTFFAKDDDYPYPHGNLIRMGIDHGFIYKGSSGSPMYSHDHKVIGMQVMKEADRDCSSTHSQGVKGISFSSLFYKANLSNYLGSATIAHSFNPAFDYLPDHCDDCMLNASKGETGTDCGGPCKPCRAVGGDNISYHDYPEGQEPYHITASNNIYFGSDKGAGLPYPVTINKSVEAFAGNEIVLGKRVDIAPGVEFEATTGTGFEPIVVVREPDFICNVHVPGLLRWGEKWNIHAGRVNRVEYRLFHPNGREIHHETKNVYYDGWIELWDTSVNDFGYGGSNIDLLYVIELWDTENTKHIVRGDVEVIPG